MHVFRFKPVISFKQFNSHHTLHFFIILNLFRLKIYLTAGKFNFAKLIPPSKFVLELSEPSKNAFFLRKRPKLKLFGFFAEGYFCLVEQ